MNKPTDIEQWAWARAVNIEDELGATRSWGEFGNFVILVARALMEAKAERSKTIIKIIDGEYSAMCQSGFAQNEITAACVSMEEIVRLIRKGNGR